MKLLNFVFITILTVGILTAQGNNENKKEATFKKNNSIQSEMTKDISLKKNSAGQIEVRQDVNKRSSKSKEKVGMGLAKTSGPPVEINKMNVKPTASKQELLKALDYPNESRKRAE